MNRLCVLTIVLLVAMATLATAQSNYGVSVEDRVVNLPNDGARWYLSVVGDANESQYRTILEWFNTDERLRDFRSQVHYCPIERSTAVFKERYRTNTSSLPTVRLQDSKGVVVYEADGKQLPFTASGLYGALANATRKVLGVELCPWRKRNDPTPTPEPKPTPIPDPDPAPAPNEGAPVVEPANDIAPLIAVVLAVVGLLVGGGVGVAAGWKQAHPK